MRAVVALLFVVSLAHADSKAIQALAKKNVVNLGALADDPELGLTDDAIVIGLMGQRIDLSLEDGCVSGSVANIFYGCNQASHTHKPAKIDVGVDAANGIAWFQVPFTAIAESDDPDTGKPTTSRDQLRTSGIAVKQGKQWKIVAQLYALLVADNELVADAKPASGAPKLTGDKKLAGVVAGWFPGGFAAAARDKTATTIASGTSQKEHATGAAALKLVASFDKLKLAPTSVDATVLAGGKVGWVLADVTMPRKGGKAVGMKLALVVVPDGTSWKWVSLQYQFPWMPIGR